MNINQYLDSTYLKTAIQAGISENDNTTIVKEFIQEAIQDNFKLVMIRPEMVAMARKLINNANSKVHVGTVISFPDGTNTLSENWKKPNKQL